MVEEGMEGTKEPADAGDCLLDMHGCWRELTMAVGIFTRLVQDTGRHHHSIIDCRESGGGSS